jgi:hypothetical protein
MATVTGLTAARMIEIEDASIVSGTIINGHLILTTYGGATVDAGYVGMGDADIQDALDALLADINAVDAAKVNLDSGAAAQIIIGSQEATLTDGTGLLQVGASGSANLGLDTNEIQARVGGASSTLYLNPHGGSVRADGILYGASSNDVSLADGTGAIQAGASGSVNMGIDGNEIQARWSNGAYDLHLNNDGGLVQVGIAAAGATGSGLNAWRYQGPKGAFQTTLGIVRDYGIIASYAGYLPTGCLRIEANKDTPTAAGMHRLTVRCVENSQNRAIYLDIWFGFDPATGAVTYPSWISRGSNKPTQVRIGYITASPARWVVMIDEDTRGWGLPTATVTAEVGNVFGTDPGDSYLNAATCSVSGISGLSLSVATEVRPSGLIHNNSGTTAQIIAGTGNNDITDGAGVLQIGASGVGNIGIDQNEIQARSGSGAASPLYLNFKGTSFIVAANGTITGTKISLFGGATPTAGIGIETSALTMWEATLFRWRIGGTTPSGGTSHMELTSTLLDVKTKRISNVSDPTAAQDAATRGWVLGQYLVPNDGSAPAIVTGVSVTAGFEALLVEWNAATEVDMINGYGQYEIQVDNNSDFSSPLVSRKVGANFAAVTGMAPGILLYVRVRSVDAWGTVGTWSSSGSGTPLYLTNSDVVDGTLNASKIVAGSILSSHIAAGTIVAEDIATGTLTSNEIAAGTIVGGDIASGTITATNIQANTLTASEIAAGAITSDEIAATTIVAGDIAANTITAGQIAANTITATEIAADAITTSELAAGAVTAGNIFAGTIVANDIASGTITTTQIATDTILAGNIAANAITSSEIAAGAITTEKLTVATRGLNLAPNSDVTLPAGWSFSWLSGTGTEGTHGDAVLSTAVEALTGTKSLKLIAAATYSPGAISSSFHVTAGESIYFSCWAKVDTNIAGGFYARFSFFNSAGTYLSLADACDNIALTTTITKKEGKVTVPATAVTATLHLGYYSPGNSNLGTTGLYIDDLVVAKQTTSAEIKDGAITAPKLVTDLLLAGNIQSSSPAWVTGVSGFKINGATGSAEFNGSLFIGGDSLLKGQISVGENPTLAGMSHPNGSLHSANHTDYRRFYVGVVGSAATDSGVSYNPGTDYSTATELDIKVKIKAPDYTLATWQTLAASHNPGFALRGWVLYIDPSGVLTFQYSANGTTVATATMSGLTFVNDTEYHIRCLFDPDNGTSETATSFYYSLNPVDDVELVTDWTQLGTTIETSPNVTLFNGSNQTMFGVHFSGFNFVNYYAGKMYSGSVRNSGSLYIHWKADEIGLFAVAGGSTYQDVVEETGKTIRVFTGVGYTSEEARVSPTGFRLRQDGSAFFGSDMVIRGDVTIGDGYGGLIESQNYVADTSGWVLNQDGFAEFSDIKARGELKASRIEATVGTDQAINGGFETDTTGWSVLEGSFARDTGTKRTGAASLKVTLSTLGGGGAGYYIAQGMYTEADPNPSGEDATYECSCWVKFKTAGDSYRMVVGNTEVTATDNTTWHEIKFTVYVPVGGDLNIWYFADGLVSTDEVWLDDLTIKPKGRLVGELTGDFQGPAPDGSSLSLPRGIIYRKSLGAGKTIDTPGGTVLFTVNNVKLDPTRRYRASCEYDRISISTLSTSWTVRIKFGATQVASVTYDCFNNNTLLPGGFRNTFVPPNDTPATLNINGYRNAGTSGTATLQPGDAGKIELILEDIGPA